MVRTKIGTQSHILFTSTSAASYVEIETEHKGVPIRLSIDVESLVRFLSPNAIRSKNRKATVAYGAVVVKSLEAK